MTANKFGRVLRSSLLAGAAVGIVVFALIVWQRRHERYGPTPQGYDLVAHPTGQASGRPIEVEDFFFYGCPHCDAFEPGFERWLSGEGGRVRIARIPVGTSAALRKQAALYYTLVRLGLAQRMQVAVFRAIHEHGRVLETDAQILRWAADTGLPLAEFKRVYESNEVAQDVQSGLQRAAQYEIDAVPAIVVAHRWVVSPTTAGGRSRAFKVLSDRVRAASSAAAGGRNAPSSASTEVAHPAGYP